MISPERSAAEKVKAGETGAGRDLETKTGVDHRLEPRRNRRHPNLMVGSIDHRPTSHLNNQMIRDPVRRGPRLTEHRPRGGQVAALFESKSSQPSFFASPESPFAPVQSQSGHKTGGAS